MKNVAIVVLSILLAAAIVLGFILHKHELGVQEALQAELATGHSEIQALQQKIAKYDTRIKELKGQVLGAGERIEAAKKRTERLESKYLDTLKGMEARLSGLENAVSLKDQVLSELKEALEKLKKDLEEARTTKDALTSRLTSKEEELSSLQNSLKEARTHIQDLEAQIRQNKARKEAMEKLKRELEEVRTAKDALTSRLASKEEQLATLQDSLKEAQDLVSELKHLLAAREAVVQDLQDQVKALEHQLADLEKIKSAAEGRIEQMKSTYNALVGDLKKRIENKEITIKRIAEKISVTFVDRILFEFGKATITPEGQEVLDKVGNILKNIQDRQVRVIGHTDPVPIMEAYQYKFPSNWELSAARASAVIRYLQEKTGVSPKNMEAVGRAFYDPVASNDTPEGRAWNRRVNIIIAPRLHAQ